jgi:succinate dehydrogenase / fumarate reductase flavoprotein subunit
VVPHHRNHHESIPSIPKEITSLMEDVSTDGKLVE